MLLEYDRSRQTNQHNLIEVKLVSPVKIARDLLHITCPSLIPLLSAQFLLICAFAQLVLAIVSRSIPTLPLLVLRGVRCESAQGISYSEEMTETRNSHTT